MKEEKDEINIISNLIGELNWIIIKMTFKIGLFIGFLTSSVIFIGIVVIAKYVK